MIECIPNVSEGRDAATIAALEQTIRDVPQVLLLNRSADPNHHRTVFTYASESGDAIREATMRLYDVAIRAIDLRTHDGQHPRVGAVDVCPLVPLRGHEMEDCVRLADRIAKDIASRWDLPVYLYEESARQPFRRELPAIRSGQFERFPEKIQRPEWAPDYGPTAIHPSAGVTIVGARFPLIAFNVQLDTDRIEVAEQVARAVRGSSGGLRHVRAIPIRLVDRGIVQVSMNLLDYRHTPIHRAFLLVREEARRHGVETLSSEIVGLVPADALYGSAEYFLRIERFEPDLVLERRLARALEHHDR